MIIHREKQIEISKSSVIIHENYDCKNESKDSDWTPKEERLVVLKVDFVVLLLLTLGLTVFQFDRMNLAIALTGGFKEDIHGNQDEINIGNELMLVCIFLLKIPSNMKPGPRKWLRFQILVFNFVAIINLFKK